MNSSQSYDRLMTEKEVHKILGIGLSTLQQWRLRGKGPKFCRLGGKMIRYRESDVRAYIDNLTQVSHPYWGVLGVKSQ
ncbi:MAG: helix-turn-helix transcriptional regulator [Desulfomonilia bacterium]